MTPERWQQVKDALAHAAGVEGAEREAFLASIHARDPDLCREVQELLRYSQPADTFLESPAVPGVIGPGSAFGVYDIQSALGKGGMGTVFLARERTLDRPVALKFLSPSLQEQDEARQRFLREARHAAALDHPYICKIFQTGEESGRPFIAMEYIRGTTLQDRLAVERLTTRDALQIVLEVAEAPEAAHAAHIVHRDLKPSNIMLTPDGHVKVLDFGLAKRVGPNDGGETKFETQTGVVQGTIAYMSPEQVRGLDLDARSDIFSLGIVLYEMLTGTHPFKGDVPAETPSLILRHAPPPLRQHADGAPPVLEGIVNRMLAKAREERYQTVKELRADLARVRDALDRSDSLPMSGESTGVTRRPWVMSRRTVVVMALLLATIAGAWGFWRTFRPAADPLSVVVLPFANVGKDPENDYLASGIAQAVTTRLHRAGLRVIPWTTVERFESDSDPLEVARNLRVSSVLTGTLQAGGTGLLVTVSLVDGVTGIIEWTAEFQESFDNASAIFAVQTRIAQGVAAGLGQRLTPEAEATLAQAESTNGAAYDLYLQGADYVSQGGEDAIAVAHDLFSRAVQMDPKLVAAHVGLGTASYERFWNGWGTLDDLTSSEASFKAALAIDPKDMRALRGLILVEFQRGNGEACLRLGRQAAQSGALDVETLMAVAQGYELGGLGPPAARVLHRVLDLDPANEAASYYLSLNLQYGQADSPREADEYLARFGSDPYIAAIAAFMHEHQGDVDGARRLYDDTVRGLLPMEEVANWYQISHLLYAGAFYERHGPAGRASAVWQKGVELTRLALQSDSNNVRMRLLLATFHGLLGEDALFRDEEATALTALALSGLTQPWDMMYLAAAHAHRGDRARAVEILERQLQDLNVASLSVWALIGPERWTSPEIVRWRVALEAKMRASASRYPVPAGL